MLIIVLCSVRLISLNLQTEMTFGINYGGEENKGVGSFLLIMFLYPK